MHHHRAPCSRGAEERDPYTCAGISIYTTFELAAFLARDSRFALQESTHSTALITLVHLCATRSRQSNHINDAHLDGLHRLFSLDRLYLDLAQEPR